MTTTALVDTGANANFIRAGVSHAPIDFTSTQVLLAEGSVGGKVTGIQSVTIRLCEQDEPILAYVVHHLREALILGCPFLERTAAVIDMQRCCISLGKLNRHQVYWRPASAPKRGRLDRTQIHHELDTSAAERLVALLEEFPDVFNDDPTLTTTHHTTHRIHLKDPRPVSQRPHRHSEEKRRVILEQIEEMLNAGIIEPSTSSYSSPVVIVKKKDGRPRFCVDFRALNERTEAASAALPLIQQTIKDLGHATIFTTPDLQSGYWQVPLADESKPLTAFSLPTGAHYQFRVMPFGLKNAPAAFQRMMARVLAGYLQEFVMVYLDDIVVYSQNVTDHLRHLHLVFERLQEHHLKCSPKKCHFGSGTIEYLGHIVSREGNHAKDEHLSAIQTAATPVNRQQVRPFLGVCNWLREFCPNFAEIAAPLTDLLQKTSKFR